MSLELAYLKGVMLGGWMSPELVYLKGVMLGDGFRTVNARGYGRVGLESIDLEFVEEFRRCIQAVKRGIVPQIGSRILPSGKVSFKFECGWPSWPSVSKGEVPPKRVPLWLKGLFDSEGGVRFNPKQYQRWISFSNGDLELHHKVKKALQDLGIQSGKLYIIAKKDREVVWKGQTFIARKNCYQFSITHRVNLQRFNDLIGFTIQRKQQKLNRMLASYKLSLEKHKRRYGYEV